MKVEQKILVLLFVFSQLGLWLWWRNRNFDLAMDLTGLRKQKQEILLAVDRQENRLSQKTSLRELTRVAKDLDIGLVKNFWQLPREALAWRQ